MSQGTDVVVVSTVGIDTGKHTLHLIGLNDEGTIVLREKLACSRIGARECTAAPDRLRSWYGNALCGARADRARS
jgi:transposase